MTDEKFTVIQPEKQRQKYDRLHYVYFDYHSEAKVNRAHSLIEKLMPALQEQGYFRAVEMPGRSDGRLEARSFQRSVMRTNCMDCLDRTNVVQSMFARHMLDRIFEETLHEADHEQIHMALPGWVKRQIVAIRGLLAARRAGGARGRVTRKIDLVVLLVFLAGLLRSMDVLGLFD